MINFRKLISFSTFSFALVIIGITLSACANRTSGAIRPDFKLSVQRHLEAVQTRDFATFASTLTKTDDLNVIFPNGALLENTQAVLDFHQNWFKDSKWIFDTTIVKVIEGTSQSTALVKYSFQDDADGAPRQAWLVLTFQLEDNVWRLIHDQNTRITE